VHYSDTLAALLCDRLANGDSMRTICADEAMPDRRTVERWMANDAEFAAKCARAREEQAEFHHDAMDGIEAKTLAGEIAASAASVVLTNKRWRMEKLKPKVYGAKLDLNHSGGMTVHLDATDSKA
jgi:hypothetical protein